MQCLADLPGYETVLGAVDHLEVVNNGADDAKDARRLGSDHPLFKSIVVPAKVTLKVGAQVMLLWNVSYAAPVCLVV